MAIRLASFESCHATRCGFAVKHNGLARELSPPKPFVPEVFRASAVSCTWKEAADEGIDPRNNTTVVRPAVKSRQAVKGRGAMQVLPATNEMRIYRYGVVEAQDWSKALEGTGGASTVT